MPQNIDKSPFYHENGSFTQKGSYFGCVNTLQVHSFLSNQAILYLKCVITYYVNFLCQKNPIGLNNKPIWKNQNWFLGILGTYVEANGLKAYLNTPSNFQIEWKLDKIFILLGFS